MILLYRIIQNYKNILILKVDKHRIIRYTFKNYEPDTTIIVLYEFIRQIHLFFADGHVGMYRLYFT